VRGPDVNASARDCTLEPAGEGRLALRLGLGQVDGLAEAEAEALVAARGDGYATVEEIRRRAGVTRAALERLAAADAVRSLGLDRRSALWAVRGEAQPAALPLFAAAGLPEQGGEAGTRLPEMPLSEHVVQDYRTLRLSLKAHPMALLRPHYARLRLMTTAEAVAAPDGRRVRTAGVVLVRQKPGSANGVVFVTVEDETGIANLVIWRRVAARFRPVVMGARVVAVEARVQRAEGVTHLVVERMTDRSGDLALLSEDAQRAMGDRGLARADEVLRPVRPDRRTQSPRVHPRDVRVIPKSRDFH
jgi:error-prone DNA polymerase